MISRQLCRATEKCINITSSFCLLFQGAGAILAVMTVNKLFGVDPIGRTLEILSKFSTQEKKRSINVDKWIGQYNDLHDDSKTGLSDRNMSYATLVNAYYELATLFYEWGWGQSFHFAYQLKGETFATAIARHEYFLAGKLAVKKGDKVIDIGCGIGGPMRNIARFTRADITGVTLNEVRLLFTGCLHEAMHNGNSRSHVKFNILLHLHN
jgi:Mycolic acid cyclopropane synthetase